MNIKSLLILSLLVTTDAFAYSYVSGKIAGGSNIMGGVVITNVDDDVGDGHFCPSISFPDIVDCEEITIICGEDAPVEYPESNNEACVVAFPEGMCDVLGLATGYFLPIENFPAVEEYYSNPASPGGDTFESAEIKCIGVHEFNHVNHFAENVGEVADADFHVETEINAFKAQAECLENHKDAYAASGETGDLDEFEDAINRETFVQKSLECIQDTDGSLEECEACARDTANSEEFEDSGLSGDDFPFDSYCPEVRWCPDSDDHTNSTSGIILGTDGGESNTESRVHR